MKLKRDDKSKMRKIVLLLGVTFSVGAIASQPSESDSLNKPTDPASEPAVKTKFKAGKDVDFEELLIQGRLKRPEISVVTGDSGQGSDGLLRLRENFVDRMSVDMGEEIR